MFTPDVSAEFRTLLLDRRNWLGSTIELAPNNTDFQKLLVEVDTALQRLATGRYGFCKVCNDQIEIPELLADPLRQYCFSHLAPAEQFKVLRDKGFAQQLGLRTTFEAPLDLDTAHIPETAPAPTAKPWRVIEALRAGWRILRRGADDVGEREVDIRRASDIQMMLLPTPHLRLETWEVYYDYAPAGPVGGDYCDLVPANTGELFLFLGDVMGKGIAASMILSRLHAVFRTLLDIKLSIGEMLERANRTFCECVQATGYYATLVCGRASSAGTLELINAGHPPPILLRDCGAERVVATGMPLGLFYASKHEVTHTRLAPGETLLIYTDGVTEARNGSDAEYGHERLARLAAEQSHLAPKELVRACRDDVSAFTSSAPLSDDLTLLALRRV